jgi:hypothetical protein
MTALFLRYSAVANNLTSILTESDMVEITCGHYPACVQRTMSSAGVGTVSDALNLLNKLELLEAGGGRKSNSESSAQNRAKTIDSNAKPCQDRSYAARPGFQNVRNIRHQGTHNCN